MTAGRWERVKVAFEEARTLESAARQQYLQALTSSDPEIAQELRGLLAAYGESESFLATAGMREAIQEGLATAGLTLVGQRLGAYRVDQLIGVGGMGEVYRGERVDGEFHQLVAIKVVRGAANAFSISRFRAERQILASLSHPNIARIYDGGTTQSDEPYLVMEYIEGQRIDEYSKSRNLSDADRLRLLETVCGAVQYAHRHNIIHRDIKPANIMVGEDGAPRLLDFGIAKLLGPEEAGGRTMTRERAATPDYASPEQLRGDSPTPAMDVYSLGVVLRDLVPGERGLDEIVRRATHLDPAQRYKTVAELSGEIERYRNRTGASAGRRWFLRPGVLWPAAVVALLGLALSTVTVMGWLSQPGLESLRGVPLTSALGQELEPSLSPEGNRVAYSWNGENRDNFDIYVKLIGPGPPLRLTTDPAGDSSPAWSRDGRSLAFLRELPVGKAQVIVIPSLGGPERPVAELFSWPKPWLAYPGPHLTWTVDGKGLIVSHRQSVDEPFALYYLSIDTGQFRKMTNPPRYTSGDTAPALSPDGRRLVFRRTTGFAAGQLYSQRVDERLETQGEPALLTPGGISSASPAWTADGREIVYSDGYYFEPRLKRLTLPWLGIGAARQQSLLLPGAFVTTSSLAGKLVYVSTLLDTNVWELRLSGKAESPTAVSLLSSTRLDSGGQYSPDGKRIAYLSQRSGSAEVWVCDRDGRNASQLTSFGDTGGRGGPPTGRRLFSLPATTVWKRSTLSPQTAGWRGN
jgi:serine/threonine protein kinase